MLHFLIVQTGDSVKAKEPANTHTLGEEVIVGETELKIKDQKLYFPPQIDPWAPVNELLVPESYVFDQGLYRVTDSLTVPHHFIHSSFLRVPVEKSFIYGDILVFLPSFEHRVATWELVIANSLGETVRRVREKGQPPAVITWDGKTDKGEPIATGEIYSFTFNAYDAQGNQTRIQCEPQRIAAVVWKEKNEWVVSVAADQLFSADGTQPVNGAEVRFDEMANVIKERFKKEVVVYVYSEQEQLSGLRSRIIEQEISRRVVLPKGAIKVVPRFIPGLQPKHSKVEIHIL